MHQNLRYELEQNGYVISGSDDCNVISKDTFSYTLTTHFDLLKLHSDSFNDCKSGFIVRTVTDINQIHNQMCFNKIKRRRRNLMNHLNEFGYKPTEFSTKYDGMTYTTFVILHIYPFYSIHHNPLIRIDIDECGLLTVSNADKILGVASNFNDLKVLLDFYFKGE